VLSWGGLDISFQRIGLCAWASVGVLRSWAGAPWKVLRESAVAVACLPSECIWFGLTATGDEAHVRFESRGGRWVRNMYMPPDWQLAWIQSAGRERPIALRPNCRSAAFVLSVRCPKTAKPKTLAITLLAPEAWRLRVGPLRLKPAEEPALVLRYSRIMPPGGES